MYLYSFVVQSRDNQVTSLPLCRREGPLPLQDVIRDYICLAVDSGNRSANTKYCIAQMLRERIAEKEGQALFAASNMKEIW